VAAPINGPVPTLDEGSRYHAVLRKRAWRSAPAAVLRRTLDVLGAGGKVASRAEHLAGLEGELGAEATGTELRRAWTVLLRSGLIRWDGLGSDGQSRFHVEPPENGGRLDDAVDRAVLARLHDALPGEPDEEQCRLLAPLLIGPAEVARIRRLLATAEPLPPDIEDHEEEPESPG
jgi:hypothetical protein